MAEPLDGGIQTVLEVYERIGWPELVSELISRDQFPRSLEQHGKNLNRLPLHLNLAAILAKFTRPEIEFETLEMDGTRGRRWLAHAPSPSLARSRRYAGKRSRLYPRNDWSKRARFYHPNGRAS